MSSRPPQVQPADIAASPEQIERAKRIARFTGMTVEQVLAQAISRGSSAIYGDALAGVKPAPVRSH